MKTQMNEAVEHLFDETVQLTGIIEYGIPWQDLLTGQANAPAEGARFDLSFEGRLTGQEINGSIKGIDYLTVRSDGRFMLNIQATIVTDDGETISLREDGILTLGSNGKPANLHLNMQFTTHSEKYRWLNTTNVWGIGNVNMNKGQVRVCAYQAAEVPELI